MEPLDYDIKLAIVIKKLRMQRGVSQLSLATSVNLGQSTYCRMERGEITIPPSRLKLIANALKISLHRILYLADIKVPKDSSKKVEFDEFIPNGGQIDLENDLNLLQIMEMKLILLEEFTKEKRLNNA